MNPWNLNLYGNYRTRTFQDIFPDYAAFKESYGVGIPKTIRDTDPVSPSTAENTLKTLYYLLYARYGNSHIASSDENQFKFKVHSLIYQYGPTWEKELEIQKSLRALDEDAIVSGASVRNYHGYNPTEEFAIGDDVDFVNEQNTQLYKKAPLEGYNNLLALLKTDVTGAFINRFKSLFLSVVNPELPLWYVTEED